MKQHRHTSEEHKGALGTVSSIIMTAGEFKPVNGAPNLALAPSCSYKRDSVNKMNPHQVKF
jgi:hypothetical protein